MKKLLSFIMILGVFAELTAQQRPVCSPVETKQVYFENFDSGTIQGIAATNCGTPWRVNDSFPTPSAPYCIKGQVKASCGDNIFYKTAVIPTASWWGAGYKFLYLDFAHICNVSHLDRAQILVRGLNSSGGIVGTEAILSFSNSQNDIYTGSGVITDGRFNISNYSGVWGLFTAPTISMWRNERIQLSSLANVVAILNNAAVVSIEVQFEIKSEGLTDITRYTAWFVDNIKLTAATTEIVPPDITLAGTPIYTGLNTSSALNKTGPFEITTTLKDNDTLYVLNLATNSLFHAADVCCYPAAGHNYPTDPLHPGQFCIDTLSFSYTRGGIDTIYNNRNPYYLSPSVLPTSSFVTEGSLRKHSISSRWTIPPACYGDTIRYTIRVEDKHGNRRDSTFVFRPTHTYTSLATNDALLVSMDSVPVTLQTNQVVPIYVTLQNKSGNPLPSFTPIWMRSVEMEYYRNNVLLGTSTWRGKLCLDWKTEPFHVGNYTALQGYDTIKVVITKVNGVNVTGNTGHALTYVVYACDSMLSGTYTIGPNALDTWHTVAEAQVALKNCGVNGPVTILMTPGTYQDMNFKGYYPGQNATNIVTFKKNPAFPVGDVIINDAGTAEGAITLDTTGYFVFNDLVLNGKSGTSYSRGVYIKGAYGPSNHISVINCKININTGTGAVTNYAGIVRSAAVSVTRHGYDADAYMTFDGNTITGAQYGIYYAGGNGTRVNQIISIKKNNISASNSGIYITYANNTANRITGIDSNRIIQAGTGTNQYAIYLSNVFATSVSSNYDSLFITGITATNSTVANINKNTIFATTGMLINTSSAVTSVSGNNISVSGTGNVTAMSFATNPVIGSVIGNKIVTTGIGIDFNGAPNTTTAPAVLVANNEIISTISAATSYGIWSRNSNNLKFINNSVYISSAAPLSNSAALYINAGSNLEIKNNILFNTAQTNDATNYPIYVQAATSPVLDYNNYYSTGGKIGFMNAQRNNMYDWRQAYPTDIHSVSLNLTFSSLPANLLPSNFDGMECPTYPTVTTDITGTLRASNATYMGAYSYTKPKDLAIVDIVSPQATSCPQQTYPITVTVRNTGNDTINFAANTLAIICRIVSGSLDTSWTFTVTSGNIAPLATMNIQVGVLALPENENISMYFTINLAGDLYPANDVLNVLNFQISSIRPYYVEDFSNNNLFPAWTMQQVSGAGQWIVQQGEGTLPTIMPTYGTGRLFFATKTLLSGVSSRAVMPIVNLDGSTNPVLEFWFAQDNVSGAQEGVTIQVSTDQGTTWLDVIPEGRTTAFITRNNSTYTTPTWVKFRCPLSTYISSHCILIGILGRGQAGNNLNIDRVVLKNYYPNDLAVEKIYALGENPTAKFMDPSIRVRLTNEGSAAQSNVALKVNVSGANTFDTTYNIGTVPINSIRTYTLLPGKFLPNPGVNTVRVTVPADQYSGNDTLRWRMNTNSFMVGSQPYYFASYHDTSTQIINVGNATAAQKVAVRYKPADTVMITAIRFYATNNAAGKRVRAFVSNQAGATIATSDIDTLTAIDVNTWVELPINNFALTSTDQRFYAGIEMMDAGEYLGAQIERPIDSSYYFMSGTTYTYKNIGRFMIGAVLHEPIRKEIALLSVDAPNTGCDLGLEPIKVTFTNNGFESLAANELKLHYSINGGTIVTETYPSAIAPHATLQYTFTSIPNLTNNLIGTDVSYTIKIWVDNVATDLLLYNDTIPKTIISKGKANRPNVASTVNVSYHTRGVVPVSPPLATPTAQGMYKWYNQIAPNNYRLVYQGNPYNTAFTVFYDTTVYVSFQPATFDTVSVGTGTLGTSADPFRFNYGYSRGRILYPYSSINKYGEITAIALDVVTPATGANGIPIKIYIKQTTATSLTASATWATEIADATLVYDGSKYFNTAGLVYFPVPAFNYTSGNLLILTETNCGGTNCQGVSGGAAYPTFRATSVSNMAQTYSVNTTMPTTALAFSTISTRLNMKFQFANATACQSEKESVLLHVPNIPNFDVRTDALLYPATACQLEKEYIKVVIKNEINNVIPANKVIVKARFQDGANDVTIIDTVRHTIGSTAIDTVLFTVPFNFQALTADRVFNYTISTDLIGESVVYRTNDTIRGSFTSRRTDTLPSVININASNYFTERYTVNLNTFLSKNYSTYYFYATPTATTTLATATTYLTPALFDTLHLWVEALTAAAGSCVTKRVPLNINVRVPDYDLKTVSLLSPASNVCLGAGATNVTLQTRLKNTMATKSIPANTFELVAVFTPTSGSPVTNTFAVAQAINQGDSIPFSFTMTLGSTTQNRIYNYVIYTRPINTSMYAFTKNDTIGRSPTLQLIVPASPTTPTNVTQTVPYGSPYTVTPTATPLNMYSFYKTGCTNVLQQGASYTTTPIISSPTTFYYSGQIRNSEFLHPFVVGTSSGAGNMPFTFTNARSTGIIQYIPSELGNYAGRIDTVGFYIHAATAGGPIPIKIWIKNDNNPTGATSLAATTYNSSTWETIVAGSTLIYDGVIGPEHAANTWFSIPIPGGFVYDGKGILIYAEHNCGSGSCSGQGITGPQFRYTAPPSGTRLLTRANTTSSAGAYSAATQRWNTRFVVNNLCETPCATITLNTTIPSQDLDMTELLKPIIPDIYGSQDTIRVKIRNNGLATASGFSVAYVLKDSVPVVETYTGTIAPGTTATYTFTTLANLSSVYFPTEFKTYIVWASDAFHPNDTLKRMLSHPAPCISRSTVTTGATISKVVFAGINNGSGLPVFRYSVAPTNPANGNGMYTDYTLTVPPAQLLQGQQYPIAINASFTAAPPGTVTYRYVYIDLNRDNEFTANEQVYASGSIAAPTNADSITNSVGRGVIRIPENAQIGLTRMRVILSQVAVSGPCVAYSNAGETEDYSVNIGSPLDTDMAIEEILHPKGATMCADPSGVIKVRIKNYAKETVTFTPNNPIVVNAVLSGARTGNYTTTVTEGTLALFESMIVELPGADFSIAGSYTVKAYLTKYQGDTYLGNDTATATGSVSDILVEGNPYIETFETCDTTGTGVFPPRWTPSTNNNNFRWRINMGFMSKESGPTHDHTRDNPIGMFAIVRTAAGVSLPPTAEAVLTTGCINMHYDTLTNYPKLLKYFEHIFSADNTTDLKVNIQVGSGSYYKTVDSLRGRTISNQASVWRERNVSLNTVNENARLRFVVSGRSGVIDPAFDDIGIYHGRPDIGITRIANMHPMEDSICLEKGTKFIPEVVVRNTGKFTIYGFSIIGTMSVGALKTTDSVTWTGVLPVGDSVTVRLDGTLHGFDLPERMPFIQLTATCYIKDDNDRTNDVKTVQSCMSVDLDDIEMENHGVVLGQNIPNPASAGIIIPYTLPENGKAIISIHSIEGQLLHTAENNGIAGENTYNFNVQNLADGIYIYALQFKDVILHKKMIVTK